MMAMASAVRSVPSCRFRAKASSHKPSPNVGQQPLAVTAPICDLAPPKRPLSKDGHMADFMSAEQRSAHMSKIRSKNTKPEVMLRKMLHRAGFRYRLYDPKLPGKPDLVFARLRKVIFVHGCFWHGHDCPVGARLPKSNTSYWAEKRLRNSERDLRQEVELRALGWEPLVVWECEIKDNPNVLKAVEAFLSG